MMILLYDSAIRLMNFWPYNTWLGAEWQQVLYQA